jgi:hypothetical protein
MVVLASHQALQAQAFHAVVAVVVVFMALVAGQLELVRTAVAMVPLVEQDQAPQLIMVVVVAAAA